MKNLIAAASAVAIISSSIPAAWAGDGLWRQNHPSAAHRTDLRTVGHDMDFSGPEQAHHMEIKSSVQVPREALKEAYMASRKAYTDKLQKYAKCTEADATKAVSTAHPGMKVDHVQLRNIRTSLVYVAVAEDNEDRYLVIVDAGTGKILLDRPIPTHHERVFAN